MGCSSTRREPLRRLNLLTLERLELANSTGQAGDLMTMLAVYDRPVELFSGSAGAYFEDV